MTEEIGLEFIFRNDLKHVLLSTLQVNESLAQQIPLESVNIYRAGFSAAIGAIATAFQMELPMPNTTIPSMQRDAVAIASLNSTRLVTRRQYE